MKTILFADDSKNIREYCRLSLEDEGFRVVLAGNGLEAVQAFFQEMPDLAVLDITMPRMDGLEALERIKNAAPQVPVVLYTAHDEDCVRDRHASLAAACVRKSEDLSELQHVIHRLTGASSSEERWKLARTGLPPLVNQA